MGAINFSIDLKLVKALQSCLPLNIFLETGTFQGDSIDALKGKFERLYSAEISPEYFAMARKRFENHSSVEIRLEESPRFLQNLHGELKDESVLYWLDAHWCVAEINTGGESSQCPLLQELSEVISLNEKSVILIDDARLFLCCPPNPHETTNWPAFSQVISKLFSLSDRHDLSVVNDVIAFYPKKIAAEFRLYEFENSVNWHEIVIKANALEQKINDLTMMQAQLDVTHEQLQVTQEQLLATHRMLAEEGEKVLTLSQALFQEGKKTRDAHLKLREEGKKTLEAHLNWQNEGEKLRLIVQQLADERARYISLKNQLRLNQT